MKSLSLNARKLTLGGVVLVLAGLFGYVLLRSGPLAPVPVTVATVERRAIVPSRFGIGAVEARHAYRIGPTIAGRVRRVEVQVGDRVRTGQLLGEMDPVDLAARLSAQDAALRRGQASLAAAEAQMRDVSARDSYARSQASRYEALWSEQALSNEAIGAKRQERLVTQAGLGVARANRDAARQELDRLRAEREALVRQTANLKLIAPVDGLVAARSAEPGTTVVAGQTVVELLDPRTLWLNVRFDQARAGGLRAGLGARIRLRSRPTDLPGRVVWIEPLADAVTEEILAKVAFDEIPSPLPPVGELAEVTVAQIALAPMPVVPNASVQRHDGQLGVWTLTADGPRFVPVKLGESDLEGRMQVLEGLQVGDRVVTHSLRALRAGTRVEVVERLPGVAP